jgi:1-acyl-sn-glycerol-3-phosphate acyltransferase
MIRAEFLDLGRVAHALGGYSHMASVMPDDSKLVSLTKFTRFQRDALGHVHARALAQPEQFTDARSVEDGTDALRRAMSHIDDALGSLTMKRRLFGKMPAFGGAAGRDAMTGALALAHRETMRAHAALGATIDGVTGARAIPDSAFESAQEGVALLHGPVAALDAPFVRPNGLERTQGLLRRVLAPVFDRRMHLEVQGAEKFPAAGPVLALPTHGAEIDPFAQMYQVDRGPIRAVAKSDFWHGVMAPVGKAIQAFGGFPVKRGAHGEDIMPIMRRLLSTGEGGNAPLVIYEDGALNFSGAPGSPAITAARMALETGAPVHPIGSYGLEPASILGSKKSTPVVVHGDPMRFDGIAPTQSNAELVREKIARVKAELQDAARARWHERQLEH